MNTSDNVCLIPAKAASTRLPKKNILKIAGKELIYYPIRAAKESGLFGENIVVSTESEEIGRIAEQHGSKVHIRDARLAKDPFGVADVADEFLNKNPEYLVFSNLFILLPTSPMIIADDIVGAFREFSEGGFKYLMSITESDHNSFRSVLLRDRMISPIFEGKIRKKSQELEITYQINGAVTIVDIPDFLRTKDYFSFPLGAYVMPRERSIDIDTEFDYKVAKIMMERSGMQDKKIKKIEKVKE